MATSLVLTICAHDRPGIMSRVSKIVANNNANWQESRMARLAGRFAGVMRVECDASEVAQLTTCLESLEDEGIAVQIHDEGDLSDYPYTRCLKIDIYGNDRPGIVSQLTMAISHAGGNIEELNSSIESAAMCGHPIFHASGIICLPTSIEEEALISAVEDLSDDLNVEISIP